jgi:hypothetical protein
MWDLVRSYHAGGGRVAILTNDLAAFHGPEWMERVTVLGEIDIVIDGSVTHVLKPDPRAYQAALAALGDPDPASVVFVDDQRRQPPRRAGVRARHRLVRSGRRRGSVARCRPPSTTSRPFAGGRSADGDRGAAEGVEVAPLPMPRASTQTDCRPLAAASGIAEPVVGPMPGYADARSGRPPLASTTVRPAPS